MELEVEPKPLTPRCQGNCGDCREPFTPVPAVLDRSLASGCPGTPKEGLEEEAGLVDHDNAPPIATGFFDPGPLPPAPPFNGCLITLPGTPCWFLGAKSQLSEDVPDMPWMVLHSKARFDHLCHPGEGLQVGGISPSPRAFDRILLKTSFCRAFRRGLGPGCGLDSRACKPPRSRACFHRDTEEQDTWSKRATSRTPMPSLKSWAPIIPRVSRASALPLGRIIYATFHQTFA